MERLSFNNFINNYMINPYSDRLSKKDHVKTLALSVLLGLFTLGIPHLGCWIHKKTSSDYRDNTSYKIDSLVKGAKINKTLSKTTPQKIMCRCTHQNSKKVIDKFFATSPESFLFVKDIPEDSKPDKFFLIITPNDTQCTMNFSGETDDSQFYEKYKSLGKNFIVLLDTQQSKSKQKQWADIELMLGFLDREQPIWRTLFDNGQLLITTHKGWEKKFREWLKA